MLNLSQQQQQNLLNNKIKKNFLKINWEKQNWGEKIFRAKNLANNLEKGLPSDTLFCSLWMNQAFFKNPSQSLFIIYQCLTLCKESEKSLELFSRKVTTNRLNRPGIV